MPFNPFVPVSPTQYQGWASFYGGNVQAPQQPPNAFGFSALGQAPLAPAGYTGGWAYPDAWANFYAGKQGFAAPQNQNTPAGALGALWYGRNASPNDPNLAGWTRVYGNPQSVLQQDDNWAKSLGNAPFTGPITGGWANPAAWAALYSGSHGFTAPENAGSPASALEAAAHIAATSSPQDNPALLGWVQDFGQPADVLVNTPNWAASLGNPALNDQGQGLNPQGGWESPLAWAAFYGGFQGYDGPQFNTLQNAMGWLSVNNPEDPSLLGWELDYGNPQTVVNQLMPIYQARVQAYEQAQQQYQQQLYQAQLAAQQAAQLAAQGPSYGSSRWINQNMPSGYINTKKDHRFADFVNLGIWAIRYTPPYNMVWGPATNFQELLYAQNLPFGGGVPHFGTPASGGGGGGGVGPTLPILNDIVANVVPQGAYVPATGGFQLMNGAYTGWVNTAFHPGGINPLSNDVIGFTIGELAQTNAPSLFEMGLVAPAYSNFVVPTGYGGMAPNMLNYINQVAPDLMKPFSPDVMASPYFRDMAAVNQIVNFQNLLSNLPIGNLENPSGFLELAQQGAVPTLNVAPYTAPIMPTGIDFENPSGPSFDTFDEFNRSDLGGMANLAPPVFPDISGAMQSVWDTLQSVISPITSWLSPETSGINPNVTIDQVVNGAFQPQFVESQVPYMAPEYTLTAPGVAVSPSPEIGPVPSIEASPAAFGEGIAEIPFVNFPGDFENPSVPFNVPPDVMAPPIDWNNLPSLERAGLNITPYTFKNPNEQLIQAMNGNYTFGNLAKMFGIDPSRLTQAGVDPNTAIDITQPLQPQIDAVVAKVPYGFQSIVSGLISGQLAARGLSVGGIESAFQNPNIPWAGVIGLTSNYTPDLIPDFNPTNIRPPAEIPQPNNIDWGNLPSLGIIPGYEPLFAPIDMSHLPPNQIDWTGGGELPSEYLSAVMGQQAWMRAMSSLWPQMGWEHFEQNTTPTPNIEYGPSYKGKIDVPWYDIPNLNDISYYDMGEGFGGGSPAQTQEPYTETIQAGYNYPSGTFAGGGTGIQAGYRYIPGLFGENPDPYNNFPESTFAQFQPQMWSDVQEAQQQATDKTLIDSILSRGLNWSYPQLTGTIADWLRPYLASQSLEFGGPPQVYDVGQGYGGGFQEAPPQEFISPDYGGFPFTSPDFGGLSALPFTSPAYGGLPFMPPDYGALPPAPYDVGQGYSGGDTSARVTTVLTAAQTTSGAPMDVLRQAAALVAGGRNTEQLQQWMADQGYPQWFNWCAEFVSAVQQAMGNAPPQPTGLPGEVVWGGPRIAASYLNWGQSTINPQPGDVFAMPGTGPQGEGGHAGMVSEVSPNGQITLIQGNPAKQFTSTFDQMMEQGYEFRTPSGEISPQAAGEFVTNAPPGPLQAGYNYPSGAFGEGTPSIQAGYNYPSGTFSGIEPTGLGLPGIYAPFGTEPTFAQLHMPGFFERLTGFLGNLFQPSPDYTRSDLGGMANLAGPQAPELAPEVAPYELGRGYGGGFQEGPSSPYDVGQGYGGGFQEMPGVQYGLPVPQEAALSSAAIPVEPESTFVSFPYTGGVSTFPPNLAAAGALGEQIPFGVQGYNQAMFAAYWLALQSSPEAQRALTRMLATEVGNKGILAANMEVGAGFSRMIGLGIAPTPENIINFFTKGPAGAYAVTPDFNVPAGGLRYWQDPGRTPSAAFADIPMEAAQQVLQWGLNLAYNPDVGPATGSGSYVFGSRPYNPLAAGPYVSQSDFPVEQIREPGVEYFVQESVPTLQNWIRQYQQNAPNYVPGSPLAIGPVIPGLLQAAIDYFSPPPVQPQQFYSGGFNVPPANEPIAPALVNDVTGMLNQIQTVPQYSTPQFAPITPTALPDFYPLSENYPSTRYGQYAMQTWAEPGIEAWSIVGDPSLSWDQKIGALAPIVAQQTFDWMSPPGVNVELLNQLTGRPSPFYGHYPVEAIQRRGY